MSRDNYFYAITLIWLGQIGQFQMVSWPGECEYYNRPERRDTSHGGTNNDGAEKRVKRDCCVHEVNEYNENIVFLIVWPSTQWLAGPLADCIGHNMLKVRFYLLLCPRDLVIDKRNVDANCVYVWLRQSWKRKESKNGKIIIKVKTQFSNWIIS